MTDSFHSYIKRFSLMVLGSKFHLGSLWNGITVTDKMMLLQDCHIEDDTDLSSDSVTPSPVNKACLSSSKVDN